MAAKGGDYAVKDEDKLRKLAAEWGIKTDGRSTNETVLLRLRIEQESGQQA